MGGKMGLAVLFLIAEWAEIQQDTEDWGPGLRWGYTVKNDDEDKKNVFSF